MLPTLVKDIVPRPEARQARPGKLRAQDYSEDGIKEVDGALGGLRLVLGRFTHLRDSRVNRAHRMHRTCWQNVKLSVSFHGFLVEANVDFRPGWQI